MKKYALNIDRLYAGQTSNAVVLRQVDEQFPVLIPTVTSEDLGLDITKDEYQFDDSEQSELSTQDEVDISSSLQYYIDECKGKYDDFAKYCETRQEIVEGISQLDQLNEFIIDYNLWEQQEFKNKGHQELYMMDDTSHMKINHSDLHNDKVYMHTLNGKAIIGDSSESKLVNSSQLNVLFPQKKISKKSMYQTQLRIYGDSEIDDVLESLRGITLNGNVSSQKCVQGVATVGDNLYVLNSNVYVDGFGMYANGETIVNKYDDEYYEFPQSMTLFQPSGDRYSYSTIRQFIDWYEKHNEKTSVKLSEDYGGNVSYLRCLGHNSYEITVSSYCPVGLDKQGNQYQLISGKEYPISSFLFNLYDNYISGSERIIKVQVPKSKDYNDLKFKFKCEKVGFDSLDVQPDVFITVDDEPIDDNEYYTKILTDTAIRETTVKISIQIDYNVDFNRRNIDEDYRNTLRNAGVMISDITIGDDDDSGLTFGDYVNEQGISESEHQSRYEQFWKVCQYKKNISYQMVLESQLRNATTNGIEFPNNYSTGDMYGDVFATKSVYDSLYDMKIDTTEDDNLQLTAIGRNYIGLCGCSNQLALFYKPTQITMDSDMATAINEQDGELKYQLVEVVKNINRFESAIKHKSNVFSVVVENSNLRENKNIDKANDKETRFEEYKEKLRQSVCQFVRETCEGVVPAHTQLFDVQFK